MTQEDKELLLKDLCSRLPYKVKCDIGENIPYTLCRVEVDINGHLLDFIETKDGLDMQVYISEIKPYLFPLSSMTEEQYESLKDSGILSNCSHSYEYVNPHIHGVSFIFKEFKTYSLELINWLLKNHFDIYGLIPMELAKDATGLNIY